MIRIFINVMWCSFLVAILAEGVFFSLFEPQELIQQMASQDFSSISIYTIAFFFFWGICFLSGSLTYYLTKQHVA